MNNATPEGKLLDLIKNDQGKMKLKKGLRIFTRMNVVLFFLIGVVLVIFLADVFTPSKKIIDYPGVEAMRPEQPELGQDAGKVSILGEVPAADLSVIEANVSVSSEERLKDLSLLGIVTGDDNQAIIEDKKANKTFFLYKGDSVRDFKVYDIKDNRVILDYKGEKAELKM